MISNTKNAMADWFQPEQLLAQFLFRGHPTHPDSEEGGRRGEWGSGDGGSASKPASQPASQPASKQASKPASKPDSRPASRPDTKPASKPASHDDNDDHDKSD